MSSKALKLLFSLTMILLATAWLTFVLQELDKELSGLFLVIFPLSFLSQFFTVVFYKYSYKNLKYSMSLWRLASVYFRSSLSSILGGSILGFGLQVKRFGSDVGLSNSLKVNFLERLLTIGFWIHIALLTSVASNAYVGFQFVSLSSGLAIAWWLVFTSRERLISWIMRSRKFKQRSVESVLVPRVLTVRTLGISVISFFPSLAIIYTILTYLNIEPRLLTPIILARAISIVAGSSPIPLPPVLQREAVFFGLILITGVPLELALAMSSALIMLPILPVMLGLFFELFVTLGTTKSIGRSDPPSPND